MVLRFLILGIILSSGLLYAQAKEGVGEVQKNSGDAPAGYPFPTEKNSLSIKKLNENIKKLEESIKTKAGEIEKLQAQAKNIDKKMEKQIRMVNENDTEPVVIDGKKYLRSRYLECDFDSGKIKEIKMVYRKRNLDNGELNEYRTLSFNPTQLDNLKILIEKRVNDPVFNDIKQEEVYKDFSSDLKHMTLKAIYTNMKETEFRLDSFVRRGEVWKELQTKRRLSGIE